MLLFDLYFRYGPCGFPRLLYRLPPCSTHQKIEDCLLAQMPTVCIPILLFLLCNQFCCSGDTNSVHDSYKIVAGQPGQ